MITVVLLAGGSGNRLWPISVPDHPKQFLSLDQRETLFQKTLKRLNDFKNCELIAVCREEHRFLIAEQLNSSKFKWKIILEPAGRNTAPAVTLAAMASKEKTKLLVLPTDHLIEDEKVFYSSVMDAGDLAEKGYLVTFGVEPTYPAEEYGYIEKGKPIQNGFKVNNFIEKPPRKIAENLITSKHNFWNSGIFLFRSDIILREIKKFNMDVYKYSKESILNAQADLDFVRVQKASFLKCPKISLDKCVMENTNVARMFLLKAGWRDVGSWRSIWELSKKDTFENSVIGNAVIQSTRNTYIRSDHQKILAIGLEDLVIVSTQDALLISKKSETPFIPALLGKLKEKDTFYQKNIVFRPWGNFQVIEYGTGYIVKKILVKSNCRLSLQTHKHRAEHWVIVNGFAKVTKGDNKYELKKNESIYIPAGTVHRLENMGLTNLELIEIQTGSCLQESDIVRLDDDYGRTH